MTDLTSHDLMNAAARVAVLMDEAATAAAEFDAERVAALDAEAISLLEALADALPEKLDKLRAVNVRLTAEAKMLREEEKALAARRKAREAGALRCKTLIAGLLEANRDTGADPKIQTDGHSYWLQSTESVRGPESAETWPERWQSVKVSPDKRAALKALKGGESVDGFELVTTEGARWR